VSEPDLVGLFVAPLQRLGLNYMVTGGVAAVAYGDPRFTRDVDIVLALARGEVGSFAEAFSEPDFYLPPREVLTEEMNRRTGGHFNVIHRDTALRADVYLVGDDPFHAWALARRHTIHVDTGKIQLAPIEYVIVRKLEYFQASGSDRHLRDIAMMLAVSGDLIDSTALQAWSARLGVSDALDLATKFDPSPD
jgi:hypothetical protein